MVIIVFISLVYHTSMLMLWAQLNVPCTCYMTSYPSAASCLDPRVQVVMVMAVFRFQWGTLGGVNSRLWPLYATPGCVPSMRLQVVSPLCDSRLWPLYATLGCGPSMRCNFVLAVGQQCSHMAGLLETLVKGHPHTDTSLTPQTRLRHLITGTSEIAFTNSKTTNM